MLTRGGWTSWLIGHLHTYSLFLGLAKLDTNLGYLCNFNSKGKSSRVQNLITLTNLVWTSHPNLTQTCVKNSPCQHLFTLPKYNHFLFPFWEALFVLSKENHRFWSWFPCLYNIFLIFSCAGSQNYCWSARQNHAVSPLSWLKCCPLCSFLMEQANLLSRGVFFLD